MAGLWGRLKGAVTGKPEPKEGATRTFQEKGGGTHVQTFRDHVWRGPDQQPSQPRPPARPEEPPKPRTPAAPESPKGKEAKPAEPETKSQPAADTGGEPQGQPGQQPQQAKASPDEAVKAYGFRTRQEYTTAIRALALGDSIEQHLQATPHGRAAVIALRDHPDLVQRWTRGEPGTPPIVAQGLRLLWSLQQHRNGDGKTLLMDGDIEGVQALEIKPPPGLPPVTDAMRRAIDDCKTWMAQKGAGIVEQVKSRHQEQMAEREPQEGDTIEINGVVYAAQRGAKGLRYHRATPEETADGRERQGKGQAAGNGRGSQPDNTADASQTGGGAAPGRTASRQDQAGGAESGQAGKAAAGAAQKALAALEKTDPPAGIPDSVRAAIAAKIIRQKCEGPPPHIKANAAVAASSAFDHQRDAAVRIASAFARGEKGYLLADGMGTGKCLAGDTPILVNGEIVSIREIADKWIDAEIDVGTDGLAVSVQDINVLSLNSNHAFEWVPASGVYKQRINEPLVKITLMSGRQVECTKAHPMLSLINGKLEWIKSGQLRPGAHLAIPAQISGTATRRDITPDQAEFLCWSIAEGYEPGEKCSPGTLRFTNKNEQVLQRYKELAGKMGLNGHIRRYGGKVPHVDICSAGMKRWREAIGVPMGRLSKDKKLPDWIVSAPADVRKIAIETMFNAEGSISEKNLDISFSSASRYLAIQISYLLLTFGVVSRIRQKRKCATNGRRIMRDYWELSIAGGDKERFAESFVLMADKDEKLRSICKVKSNTNVDSIPLGNLANEIADSLGIGIKRSLGQSGALVYNGKQHLSRTAAADVARNLSELSRTLPDRRDMGLADSRDLRNVRVRKQRLAEMDRAAALKYAGMLQELVDMPLRFDEIKEITETRRDYVYDLVVPETHNFVGGWGGMILHNTISILATLAQTGSKRALVVVPNRGLIDQWIGKEDEGNRGGDLGKCGLADHLPPFVRATSTTEDYGQTKGHHITTYAALMQNPSLAKGFDMVVFDEAHMLGNVDSTTSKAADAVMRDSVARGGRVLFSTATPFQKFEATKYLWPLGLWDDDEAGRGHDAFMRAHGVTVNKSYSWKDRKWNRTYERRRGHEIQLLGLHEAMLSRGNYLHREMKLDGLNNQFTTRPLEPHQRQLYDTVMAAMNRAARGKPPSKARTIQAQRYAVAMRMLESFMVPHSIRAAQAEMAKDPNRHVAFFVQSVSDIDIGKIMRRAGVPEHIAAQAASLKSPADQLAEAFGRDQVMKYYGSNQDDPAEYNGRKDPKTGEWIEPTKRIAVVSYSKGGTGLSLHDTRGDHPRSQYNLSVPYSALKFTQATARSHRINSASETNQYFLLPEGVEEARRFARITAVKLKNMGAGIRGIETGDVGALELARYEAGMMEAA